jgi:hypothetical protein
MPRRSRIEYAGVGGYGPERAQMLLEEGLRRLGKRDADLSADRKLAAWKVVFWGQRSTLYRPDSLSSHSKRHNRKSVKS